MTDSPITIRSATTADDTEIRRLAYLDSAPIPAHPILLASQGDRLLAALSLTGGAVIADPFAPTAPAVELLQVRASHLRSDGRGAARGFRRLFDLSAEYKGLTHPR